MKQAIIKKKKKKLMRNSKEYLDVNIASESKDA